MKSIGRLIWFGVIISIIALLWQVATQAGSNRPTEDSVDLKTCVQMCQDHFCTVDIENNVNCPDRGFDTCQHNCRLKFR